MYITNGANSTHQRCVITWDRTAFFYWIVYVQHSVYTPSLRLLWGDTEIQRERWKERLNLSADLRSPVSGGQNPGSHPWLQQPNLLFTADEIERSIWLQPWHSFKLSVQHRKNTLRMQMLWLWMVRLSCFVTAIAQISKCCIRRFNTYESWCERRRRWMDKF